uniref:Methyltransferase domain protein n=1 Tax=uncultured bacterium CSL1 TaxID=1091565 RepID=G4WVB9_9BACT|nr:methyltransferase domain protein [uncultured bacterium CSL1]
MFTPDVVSLKQFYASPLGARAAGAIGRMIRRLWPQARGEMVIGIGYALPFLEPYRSDENQVFAAMPAFQGAIYWPVGQPNRVFLSEESQLPVPAGYFNRALLIHAAEASEQLHAMLEEVWRLLTPGGRLLIVVPNRRSPWARSPRTPFGYGRPFSLSQIKHLLAEVEFTVMRCETALHMPPLRSRWALKIMPCMEVLLRPLGALIGGVLVIEAEKQIYAALREPVMVSARRKTTVIAQPAMSLKRWGRR